MEFFRDMIDFGRNGDITIYFIIGAASAILFVLRLAITLIFGLDQDVDIDAGGDVDVADVSGGSFQIFSLLSILSFFMGLGWMGVACRHDWGLGSAVTILIAVAFGVLMMLLASLLVFWVRRLKHEPLIDLKSAIGTSGRVYLTIPPKGEGRGQVEVTVSGQRRVMHAVSNGGELAAFSAVTIVDVIDDGTMIVEQRSS